jgi:predicted RecA/RadA family phage recombinase
MPNVTFLRDGRTINYTPAAAIADGAVVIVGDIIAYTKMPIAAGQLGALHTEGQVKVIKSGSSGPVFALGDPVFWDATNSLATDTAGVYIGTAVDAAGASQAWVEVEWAPQAVGAGAQFGLVSEDVSLTSASKTLDAEDVGKVMTVIAGSATNVITLPATAIGLRYTIRSGITGGVGTTVNRIAISPAAADKIMGADLAGVDNKDRILASATVQSGDFTTLVADGVNGWFIVSERGIWTNEP